MPHGSESPYYQRHRHEILPRNSLKLVPCATKHLDHQSIRVRFALLTPRSTPVGTRLLNTSYSVRIWFQLRVKGRSVSGLRCLSARTPIESREAQVNRLRLEGSLTNIRVTECRTDNSSFRRGPLGEPLNEALQRVLKSRLGAVAYSA